MPAPDYIEELRHDKFPVDANTRPVSVLYTYDPATNSFAPISSVGVTGVGQVLNTNLVGGILQVENLHVVMDSTGLHNVAGTPINPATENTLQDVLEALGGGSSADKQSFFDSEDLLAGIPTTVLTYIVPSGKKFKIENVRGWADVDAEYYIKIDSTQVDGYRTSPAQLTMSIESAAIQYALAGQAITVGATHFKTGVPQTIKIILQGVLETI